MGRNRTTSLDARRAGARIPLDTAGTMQSTDAWMVPALAAGTQPLSYMQHADRRRPMLDGQGANAGDELAGHGEDASMRTAPAAKPTRPSRRLLPRPLRLGALLLPPPVTPHPPLRP